MDVLEAKEIVNELERKPFLTKEEEFRFTETLLYLFNETKDGEYLASLGSYYYENKVFDLALKYYTQAVDLGLTCINGCLGYIWYYGRTGKRDYEKAYKSFKAMVDAKTGDRRDKGEVPEQMQREARLKIADMYKNGYYLDKDYDKYKEIVNDLYNSLYYESIHNVYDVYTEVALRKARILEEEGNVEEALRLYFIAKEELSMRLNYNLFFGDVNQMSWTINDIYRLIEFDYLDFDLYDLFYLLKDEHIVTFKVDNKKYTIESKKDSEGMAIKFNGSWHRTFNDLILKESINNCSLPNLYFDNRLDSFEVEK